MRVSLQLKGPLEKYGPEPGLFTVEAGAAPRTVQELLAGLGVPLSAVVFVTVNGVKRGLDYGLKGGERILVFPRVAGG